MIYQFIRFYISPSTIFRVNSFIIDFISTFFNIWGLPAAEQIQQTFIAFDVLCGAIVSIAKANYDAGGGAE